MAWSSAIYPYTIFNSVQKGTSSVSLPPAGSDLLYAALYGTGTPVQTATTLAATEYGASWNTCTETSGTGYTAAGASITTVATVQNPNSLGNNVMGITAANTSWGPSATLANVYGTLVYDSTVPAHPGICYNSFGGSAQSVSTGTFTISWGGGTGVICQITC